MNSKPLSLFAACLMTFALVSAPVEAKGTAKDSVRYSVRTPHSRIEAGAAKIRVQATPDELVKLITDYNSYPRFISRFEKVKILSRKGSQVDVYMQVPILKGAAKIWAVVRFSPAREENGESIVEGHMVRGNVERLDAVWRVRKLDAQSSQLRLEMLLVPKMPVPGSLVTGEVAYAADSAISDMRTHAEKR